MPTAFETFARERDAAAASDLDSFVYSGNNVKYVRVRDGSAIVKFKRAKKMSKRNKRRSNKR